MATSPHDFQPDIDLLTAIPMVPRILEVLTGSSGMRIAVIARVTEERWVVCSALDQAGFGLQPAAELPIETTFCQQIRRTGELVHFDDATIDPVYCGHPSPSLYGFRSYVSVPINLPDGEFFGTLCGLDPEPHAVSTAAVLGMFQIFAGIIGEQIAMRRRLVTSETNLADARAVAALREQFIAVLGHDLRSPLASIDSCIHLLEAHSDLEAPALELTRIASQNVRRMAGLIEDVLDLARSRLGDGIVLNLSADGRLAAALHQVIEEVGISHPDMRIETDIAIDCPVPCDIRRVGQLFANLLGNAALHGDPTMPVAVRARVEDGGLVMTVTNSGAVIDAATMQRLFEPFVRQTATGAVAGTREGLGLGLFIASQIARAHGGTLTATSDQMHTRFDFRLPLPGQ